MSHNIRNKALYYTRGELLDVKGVVWVNSKINASGYPKSLRAPVSLDIEEKRTVIPFQKALQYV